MQRQIEQGPGPPPGGLAWYFFAETGYCVILGPKNCVKNTGKNMILLADESKESKKSVLK